ncbi:MAG TPA: glycosyltransferase family 4 protein [Candidatus Baltobacteraceae bacterium]
MRIALVTPWFGADLIGGAERLAFDLSRAIARKGAQVEVLTTCCRSFHDDWSANYHRPGVTNVDGVNVRRFKVDARDRVAFSRANSALLALRRDQLRRDLAPLPATTDAFISQGIRSSTLLGHLRDRGSDYDAILFLPYLYTTTVEGLPLVADRAFLIPCLHDEAYAYLDTVRDVFRQARGLLFNSEGERNVAASLYGPWVHFRAAVIGHAVTVAPPPSGDIVIKGFAPQRARYILFLGRGDRTKNIDLALDAFARFRASRQTTALQFVIAGPHAQAVRGAGVIDLGAVTEEAKSALLAHTRALVQPSTNESFSRTVFEAWHLRRPVVVHRDSAATSEIVERSGGGWTARTVEEWTRALAIIDESSDAEIDGAGMRGRAVALQSGSWDDVAKRTLTAIETRLGHETTHIDRIVSLERWAAPRAKTPRFDDGRINVLSLAPVDAGSVQDLIEILAALQRRAGRVRVFVLEQACSNEARDALSQLVKVTVLGEDVSIQLAAFRDAHVACAFGRPRARAEALEQALWFDIPIVAFDDVVQRKLIEDCGIVCYRGSLYAAAALLRLAATNVDLRAQIVAEERRNRRNTSYAKVRRSQGLV